MGAVPAAGPVVQGPAPAPVENAFRALLAQAALSVVSLVVTLATAGQIKDQIRDADPTMDTTLVDTAANVAITFAVVVGVLGLFLWLLLAFKVRAGKSWARIVTFVFAGLGLVLGLFSFAQPASAISRVVLLLSLVISAAVIWFLTRKESAEYFVKRP
jgi:hypothetical protein